jgi:hypothetical protein
MVYELPIIMIRSITLEYTIVSMLNFVKLSFGLDDFVFQYLQRIHSNSKVLMNKDIEQAMI